MQTAMQEPAPQTALNAEQRAMLQENLRSALDSMTLLTAENELKAYECDALTVFTRPPLAVCPAGNRSAGAGRSANLFGAGDTRYRARCGHGFDRQRHGHARRAFAGDGAV